MILALAAITVRGRELPASGVLIVLFAVYSGIYAARNIPVSSILLVAVVGPLMRSQDPNNMPGNHRRAISDFFQRMTAIEAQKRWPVWSAAALLITFLIAINGGRVGSNILMDAHFDNRRMPVGAIDYLSAYNWRGPVLTPDAWGGYVIYRLYPKAQVVLDDRHDLYGAEFFKSYLKLIHVEPGWEDFLWQHPSEWLLLPRDSALADRLRTRWDWKAVYSDDVATIFIRPRRTD